MLLILFLYIFCTSDSFKCPGTLRISSVRFQRKTLRWTSSSTPPFYQCSPPCRIMINIEINWRTSSTMISHHKIRGAYIWLYRRINALPLVTLSTSRHVRLYRIPLLRIPPVLAPSISFELASIPQLAMGTSRPATLGHPSSASCSVSCSVSCIPCRWEVYRDEEVMIMLRGSRNTVTRGLGLIRRPLALGGSLDNSTPGASWL